MDWGVEKHDLIVAGELSAFFGFSRSISPSSAFLPFDLRAEISSGIFNERTEAPR
jgi:hypothetical protein